MTDTEKLLGSCQTLLEAGVPLSFYDALLLIRRAQRVAALDDRVAGALIALHDLPASTDGARGILSEFLGAQAQRQASERELGAQPLQLTASGKTVRIPLGGRLLLELDERAGAGFRWRVVTESRGLGCQRSAAGAGAAHCATFTVVPRRVGVFRLRLGEDPPPSSARTSKVEPRQFELRVVVEAGD